MFVFAGNDADFGHDNNLFTFDLETMKWEQIEPKQGAKVPFGR